MVPPEEMERSRPTRGSAGSTCNRLDVGREKRGESRVTGTKHDIHIHYRNWKPFQ